jgi:hypothetical protein
MKKKPSKPSGFKAFLGTEPVKVEDSSEEQVSGLWIKAVIILGTAIFIGVKMKMNWIVDINDPEFNPLTYMVLGLVVFGGVTVGQAMWLGAKRKRFGKSVMQLSGDGVARLGQEVKGVVRTAKVLRGAATMKVSLRCEDTHQFRDMDVGTKDDYRAFVVWEETIEVPLVGVDTVAQGVPFRFQMPEAVGEEARRKAPPNPYFKGAFALMIPGLKRRIWTHGVAPMARTWKLQLQAETIEGRFQVVFDVPVEQR